MDAALSEIAKHSHSCQCNRFPLYLCVFVLLPLLFSVIWGRTRALSSECKIEQPDFKDWMPFLSANRRGNQPKPRSSLRKYLKTLHRHSIPCIANKTKII